MEFKRSGTCKFKKNQEAYEALNQAVIINPANLTAVKNRNNAQKFINVPPAPNFSVEPVKVRMC